MLKNNELVDLFVLGKEVDVTDTVKVWIQKVNSAEHENIVRRANAARARVLAAKKDPESDEYQSIYGDVIDMDKDEMIDIIIRQDVSNRLSSAESEISERPEWAENNYLQGLRDSWEDGLKDRYFTEKDEESTKVLEELKRFGEQVAKEVEAERESLMTSHLERSLEAVIKDAVETKIETEANLEWIKAFRKGQLIYGVRDISNRGQRLLNWDTIDALQDETYAILSKAYSEIAVDPIEGKD